jgi:hypothetical protein
MTRLGSLACATNANVMSWGMTPAPGQMGGRGAGHGCPGELGTTAPGDRHMQSSEFIMCQMAL